MARDRFWLACAALVALAASALARGAGGQVRPPAAADSAAPYDCRPDLTVTDSGGPTVRGDRRACEFLPSIDDDSAVWVVQRAAMLGTDRARTAAVLIGHAYTLYRAAERAGRLAGMESAARFAELAYEHARLAGDTLQREHAEFLVFLTAVRATVWASTAAAKGGDCAVALRALRYAVRARETMPAPRGPDWEVAPMPDWRPLYRRATGQVDRLCVRRDADRPPG